MPSTPRDLSTTCLSCGWTSEQLRDTGRMGCARCYEAFAPMVAQAVAHLHSSGNEPPTAPVTPPLSEREPLPWPTRRARRGA